MLESSKFDCPILTKHNFIPCQQILMKFSENCQNILVYWLVKFYLIIFKIDWFIAKTKRVSVQLGHSVELLVFHLTEKFQSTFQEFNILTIFSIYKLQLAVYMFMQMKNLPGINPLNFTQQSHKYNKIPTINQKCLFFYVEIFCDRARFNSRDQNSRTIYLKILLINLRWVLSKRVLKTFWSVQLMLLFSFGHSLSIILDVTLELLMHYGHFYNVENKDFDNCMN